ncbi:hypothetical protein ACFX13_024255 [Malus domestica]
MMGIHQNPQFPIKFYPFLGANDLSPHELFLILQNVEPEQDLGPTSVRAGCNEEGPGVGVRVWVLEEEEGGGRGGRGN